MKPTIGSDAVKMWVQIVSLSHSDCEVVLRIEAMVRVKAVPVRNAWFWKNLDWDHHWRPVVRGRGADYYQYMWRVLFEYVYEDDNGDLVDEFVMAPSTPDKLSQSVTNYE